MTTADMAMRMDPEYEKVSRHFHEKPGRIRRRLRPGLVKLTHRDMDRRGGAR